MSYLFSVHTAEIALSGKLSFRLDARNRKYCSRKNKNILVKLLFLEIRSYTNNHVEPEIKNVGFESVINLYEIVINKIMQFVLNSYLSK